MISESSPLVHNDARPEDEALNFSVNFETHAHVDKVVHPWFVLPILCCATVAVSAAGGLTKRMENAAPISQAGWRLQLTSLILLPGFSWQFYNMKKEERQETLRSSTAGIVFLSSISLAFHFGLWIWSLQHTSLPHSLLLVSTPPVIVGVSDFIRGMYLSREEAAGIAFALGGAVVMAAGYKTDYEKGVSLVGDLAAFLGAVAFVAYISAGKHLRGWMPLYVYTFPVNAGAAVCLTLAGIFLEGTDFSSSGAISGPFAWTRPEYLLLNFALALGPGFVGHTGFNAVLRYCSALLVAMAITVEPLLGSVIGWALNVSDVPGLWTCVGGALMILGTLWVSYSSERQAKVTLPAEIIAGCSPSTGDLLKTSDGMATQGKRTQNVQQSSR